MIFILSLKKNENFYEGLLVVVLFVSVITRSDIKACLLNFHFKFEPKSNFGPVEIVIACFFYLSTELGT